jgi:phage terminase large subunit-like protein
MRSATKRKSESSIADDVIEFMETYLFVPEGGDVGKPLRLRPWQRDIIRQILDNDTRLAILSFARKNGKTLLCAALMLAALVGPLARRNSLIVSAAQSRDQAALVFSLAAKMVRLSPELNDMIAIRDSRKELFCGLTGATYRALSADADTGHGISPLMVLHDELGRVRGPRSALYEVLESSMGAQSNPLSIIISTQAADAGDLLSLLIDDAATGADPSTVLVLYTAPMDADPFSDDTIRLANPAFDDFQNAREVRAAAAKAERMPGFENSYRNLHLNQRVLAAGGFVATSAWDACAAVPKSLEGVTVDGGLDLSSVADLTALVLVGEVDGIWQVHPTFYLPAQGLAEKARSDHAPYDLWAKSGHLVATPGASVDYEFVAHRLFEIFGQYKVRRIGFDRWQWERLKPSLLRTGFSEEVIEKHFVQFGQGYRSMSPALNTMESVLLNARMAHGGHPVLKMCALNATVEVDAAGNRKLTKSKSTGRIDGLVALTMALDTAAGTIEEIDPAAELNRLIIERGGFA